VDHCRWRQPGADSVELDSCLNSRIDGIFWGAREIDWDMVFSRPIGVGPDASGANLDDLVRWIVG
jgi:hypothetical protein